MRRRHLREDRQGSRMMNLMNAMRRCRGLTIHEELSRQVWTCGALDVSLLSCWLGSLLCRDGPRDDSVLFPFVLRVLDEKASGSLTLQGPRASWSNLAVGNCIILGSKK